MAGEKKPIQRTLILAMLVFTASLCAVLSIQVSYTLSRAIYQSYDERLENILKNVKSNLDVDDLGQCAQSGKRSWKYMKMQQMMNTAVDDFDLDYLYAVIPGEKVMVNLISATSEKERAAGEEDMPLLAETTAYSKEELARYRSYWDSEGVSYFNERSEFGSFYTAVMPLRDSDGETVGLLCADLSTEFLQKTLQYHTISTILIIVAIGFIFAIVSILWLRKNVIHPLRRLEKSTREYAQLNRDDRNGPRHAFVNPEIHTGNEVQSLSEAFVSMSEEMDQYISDILLAEERAREAEAEAKSMTMIAYQDPLTHVKSKAAYDRRKMEIEWEMDSGKAEFAVVMVDLNELKHVNDSYGHANGDHYIIGASQILCRVFDHSPVFRIGGDEFVAILQGEDYANREKLFLALQEAYRKTAADETREPWQQYSAACGMAVYQGIPGETFESVAQKADAGMYQDKHRIKTSNPEES